MDQILILAVVAIIIIVLLLVLLAVLRGAGQKDRRPKALHRAQEAAQQAAAARLPFDRASLPPQAVAEIEGRIASHNPIAAIKALRENSDLGLADAKRVIDAWHADAAGPAGGAFTPTAAFTPPSVSFSGTTSFAAPAAASAAAAAAAPGGQIALPAETIAEIDRLVGIGQKIQAIKVFRTQTGVDLASAKTAIDMWVPGAHS